MSFVILRVNIPNEFCEVHFSFNGAFSFILRNIQLGSLAHWNDNFWLMLSALQQRLGLI